MADLSAASLDDVKEFFRTYYTPNNLSLVIAGDFDPAEAKRLVEKYFGPIPAGSGARPPGALGPDARRREGDRGRRPRAAGARLHGLADAPVLRGRTTPSSISPRRSSATASPRASASRWSTIGSSRPRSTPFRSRRRSPAAFVVIATARPGSSLAEIEEIVGAEIARLAKRGPTPPSSSAPRPRSSFSSSLGSSGSAASAASPIASISTTPSWAIPASSAGTSSATATRPRRTCSARWRGGSTRPTAWSSASIQRSRGVARPTRSTAPPSRRSARTARSTPPACSRVVSTTASRCCVVERADLPKVAVELVTRAGSGADPAGKEGVASLALTTIDMGTKSRDALEIEKALGDLGTELTGDAGREASTLSLEVLKRNLDPALAIVADVVQHPTFPESEVERERKRRLDTLAQQEKNGNAIAARVRAMLAFGPAHPYGRPSQGLAATRRGAHPRGPRRLPRRALAPGELGARLRRRSRPRRRARAGAQALRLLVGAARRPRSRSRRPRLPPPARSTWSTARTPRRASSRSSCRRRRARATTATRSTSPTRSGAAAVSARA